MNDIYYLLMTKLFLSTENIDDVMIFARQKSFKNLVFIGVHLWESIKMHIMYIM